MEASWRRKLPDWLAQNPVVVLTIAGAGFYAAVRFGLQTFYGRLGLAPQDVGLGYGEGLARAAGIAVWFLVANLLVYALSTLRRFDRARAIDSTLSKVLMPGPANFVVVGFLTLLLVMWVVARDGAIDVQKGKRVRPFFFFDSGIRAERASVKWTGASPSGLDKRVATHRLMFLGESGGSVFVYDVDSKGSIRIPSSDVVVSILP